MIHRIDARQLDRQFRAARKVGCILGRNHPSGHRSARFRDHHPVRNQIPCQRPMENRIRLGLSAIQRIRHANRNHRSRRNRHRLGHRRRRRRGGGGAPPAPAPEQEQAGGGGGGGGGVLSATTCLCRLRLWLRRRRWLSRPAGATTRLFTTVLTPSTEALSAAASAREASLSTLPFNVATPLATPPGYSAQTKPTQR